MKPPIPLPDEDARSRATFLAFCPCCSHVAIPDLPDIMVAPSYRRHDATRMYPVEHFTLDRCCRLSEDCPWFDTKAEVAQWWIKRRQEPSKCEATNNRRRVTLQRLYDMQLEPMEAYLASAVDQRDSHQD